ncbi:MAG: M67 family metallopeptidase [Gammaproteobacteria bacterium]|nr:M67 family metallopeptidase [Gammaproteobacteria bacterium]
MQFSHNTVSIPRPLVNQMLHHAQLSPEKEICGLIGARNSKAASCYPVRNIADNQTFRYELDPKQHLEAMRKMRSEGEDLFAIYHSHPHSQARPSKTDIEMANYPEALYLIISLNTKGVLELRGFYLNREETTTEVQLNLEAE